MQITPRLACALVALVLSAGMAACGREPQLTLPGRECSTATASTGRAVAGPVFFIADPSGCHYQAYTYIGARTDQTVDLPSCAEVCPALPIVAPDGWIPSGPGPLLNLSSMMWATDSRHVCGLSEFSMGPIRVIWGDMRNLEQDTVTLPDPLGSQAWVSLLGCDLAADRAVLESGPAPSTVETVAVVSLRHRKIVSERHFPNTPHDRVIAVSLAPNGQVMAVQHAEQPPSHPAGPAPTFCSPFQNRAGQPSTVCSPVPQAPLPMPTTVEVDSLSGVPYRIGLLDRKQIVGWSGDGSRMIVQSGSEPSTRLSVVTATNGQVVWQTAGTLESAVSAPGSAATALQVVDRSQHTSSIVILDTLGHAHPLKLHGSLVPPQP